MVCHLRHRTTLIFFLVSLDNCLVHAGDWILLKNLAKTAHSPKVVAVLKKATRVIMRTMETPTGTKTVMELAGVLPRAPMGIPASQHRKGGASPAYKITTLDLKMSPVQKWMERWQTLRKRGLISRILMKRLT